MVTVEKKGGQGWVFIYTFYLYIHLVQQCQPDTVLGTWQMGSLKIHTLFVKARSFARWWKRKDRIRWKR